MTPSTSSGLPRAVVEDVLRRLPIELAKAADVCSFRGQYPIELEADGMIRCYYHSVTYKLATMGLRMEVADAALREAINCGLFAVAEGSLADTCRLILRSTPKLWGEPRTDGPTTPGVLRWKDKEDARVQTRSWRILDFMWDRIDAEEAVFAHHVWGRPAVKGATLRSAVHFANEAMARMAIPGELATKSGKVYWAAKNF